MTCLREMHRLGRRALAPLSLLALAAGALVGCGGGTSQVEAFVPARVVILGDESSVVVDDGAADGLRYTINDRTSATAGKCLVLPTFSQSMVSGYGMATKECNPNSVTPKAVVMAKVNAQVDDPANGLGQQVAQVSNGLGKTDMVLVHIGANDMIALYESVRDGRMTAAAGLAEAQRRGRHAAETVNAILGTGARAVVTTIPDMGLSPYAIAQERSNPGARATLAAMSYEYNAYLRTSIDGTRFDGRNYGLVLADDIVAAMAKVPGAFFASPAIATEPACSTASVLDCTTTNLVTGASATSHLWASDRHLGPIAHARIGAEIQSRMFNNPF